MKNTNKYNLKNEGFSTLFVVIILGSLSLALSLSLSTSSVWSIKSSINSKNLYQAKSLVNACAEVALETIRENNNYIGTNNVVIDGNTCTYSVSNTGGNTRYISVSGSVRDVFRKLDINTSSFNPLVIYSWIES